MKCIICHSPDLVGDYYRPNKFNNKEFHYFLCTKCHSVSIDPIPSLEEFELMYGENDHSYLGDFESEKALLHDFTWNNYNHQKYQVDEFDDSLKLAKGHNLLDFACGNGFYLAYALSKGFEPIGIEFNHEFAQTISSKTNLRVLSFEEFEENYSDKTFDIIHFGHILEHLADPYEILSKIKKYAHDDTIIIVDGPLENNNCLSQKMIRLGSKIIRKKYNFHAPQHLTFTTANSQQLFFKRAGLQQLKFKVMEQDFPLRLRGTNSISGKLKAIIAFTSIQFSKLFPKMGNVFHYVGKFEK